MKKWTLAYRQNFPIHSESKNNCDEIIQILLENRGIKTAKEKDAFLYPKEPVDLTPKDVHIDDNELQAALTRIVKAIKGKESIVVYADYDADGVTAGAIMWEVLHKLGAQVMPYIPHRADEGYGFSIKGLDFIIEMYHPTLVISVDHGITAHEQIAYSKEKGIDVIVSDHHVKPEKLPNCIIVHTTDLSGAGVSWFLAKELLKFTVCSSQFTEKQKELLDDLLGLATIGTIADMVPLVGGNRSITKYGLVSLQKTKRVGLLAIIKESGIDQKNISSYVISHIISPRINAMGRLEHAMDSLRLLCTTNQERAEDLANKLGATNKERQQLTLDTTIHAKDIVKQSYTELSSTKVMVISHESYNQGIIGLVAGKIVETYYRPSIVIAKGENISRASARSIPGFNIVEAIRSLQDTLIDVGGHPMAAGFTIETKKIPAFIQRFEALAERFVTEELLTRIISVDMEIPLESVDVSLWNALLCMEPFGFGNPQPVFVSRRCVIKDIRVIGNGNKHLKLKVSPFAKATGDRQKSIALIEAIAFGKGEMGNEIKLGQEIDIAYTIDLNEWNGTQKMQLVVKDIVLL